jgi:hypothetical protein
MNRARERKKRSRKKRQAEAKRLERELTREFNALPDVRKAEIRESVGRAAVRVRVAFGGTEPEVI